ncbi:hypothetical protein C8R45DRAFT_1102142 [Mycena sanguinolenta]|nr:hypothetical protein C8R45DRAFT_1102142 [Mycena sanguinolenta]
MADDGLMGVAIRLMLASRMASFIREQSQDYRPYLFSLLRDSASFMRLTSTFWSPSSSSFFAAGFARAGALSLCPPFDAGSPALVRDAVPKHTSHRRPLVRSCGTSVGREAQLASMPLHGRRPASIRNICLLQHTAYIAFPASRPRPRPACPHRHYGNACALGIASRGTYLVVLPTFSTNVPSSTRISFLHSSTKRRPTTHTRAAIPLCAAPQSYIPSAGARALRPFHTGYQLASRFSTACSSAEFGAGISASCMTAR